MCDQTVLKIEEAILHFQPMEIFSNDNPLETATNLTDSADIALDYILPNDEGVTEHSEDTASIYKSAKSFVSDSNECDEESKRNGAAYSQNNSSPGSNEHQQMQPSVEQLLQQAAFVLSTTRSLTKRRGAFSSSRKRRSRTETDTDAATGNWYGCRSIETKKFQRLSLRGWRIFNRLLHQTQQSLKHIDIHRRVYK